MDNKQIEKITDGSKTIAIIIRADYSCTGIKFFTPNSFSQQLGYMNHPAGYKIEPHTHNPVLREILNTQEVLVIRKGTIKVFLFNSNKDFICDRILKTGDIILLSDGGHSFEMLEETAMIEIKQGPYLGEKDKTRFVKENK